jgi:demethylmenaquinone methyltransferase / 2-methoxy-6-polyprenyl-1,4-benzoquinol methylase
MRTPHRPLTAYYQKEADRPGYVRHLFDRTAADYDRVERAMALGSGSWYRRRALQRAGLKAGMRVLDIGTGTGLTAREAFGLVGPLGEVTGVDPSTGMMERAKVPYGLLLVGGTAEAIPAPAGAVDFVSMGYALRHIGDLSAAFAEFMRVLVPGGRICLLEITSPHGGPSRWLLKVYMRTVIPLVARCMAAHRDMPELMRYYWDTIEACVDSSLILDALSEAGFVQVYRHVELGIFSEYCARKPLSPRAGCAAASAGAASPAAEDAEESR